MTRCKNFSFGFIEGISKFVILRKNVRSRLSRCIKFV